MKSIYLLSCLLFINASGVGWDPDEEPLVPSAPPTGCLVPNCTSLRKECMQHNKKWIFSVYLLNKKANKKKTREEVSVLSFLPEPLRHMVGDYAREIPTHYTIQSYTQEPGKQDFSQSGNLSLDADGTGMQLVRMTYGKAKYASMEQYSIALTATEAIFFKDLLQPYRSGTAAVDYEVSERRMQFVTQGDLVCLKLRQTDATKALKSAGLLPNKKRKK